MRVTRALIPGIALVTACLTLPNNGWASPTHAAPVVRPAIDGSRSGNTHGRSTGAAVDAPADDRRVNDQETISAQVLSYVGENWLLITLGILVIAVGGTLMLFRRPPRFEAEPPDSNCDMEPLSIPYRSPYGSSDNVPALRAELAEMGNRLLVLERQMQQLRAMALPRRDSRGEAEPARSYRQSPERHIASHDQPLSVEPRSLEATPRPEATSTLLRDFATLVARRAVDSDEFVKRYAARAVEKTGASGQFATTVNSSDVWAVPIEGERAWLLLPGRDTIKRWNYLAAMHGSGAAERLNGSYELVQSGEALLRILSPAIASSDDGRSFHVVQLGRMSGITQ